MEGKINSKRLATLAIKSFNNKHNGGIDEGGTEGSKGLNDLIAVPGHSRSAADTHFCPFSSPSTMLFLLGFLSHLFCLVAAV
jgi:hypothetical protein